MAYIQSIALMFGVKWLGNWLWLWLKKVGSGLAGFCWALPLPLKLLSPHHRSSKSPCGRSPTCPLRCPLTTRGRCVWPKL
jgi:hypothetical protein